MGSHAMSDEPRRWSSRKLCVAVGSELVFTVLLWFEKIPPETYYNLTLVALGGYFAGNVGEHFSRSVKP